MVMLISFGGDDEWGYDDDDNDDDDDDDDVDDDDVDQLWCYGGDDDGEWGYLYR